jgi:hypothetical protein
MDCLWRGRDGVERRLERWDPYISPLALDVISFFFPAEPVSAPTQFGRDANQPINCASRLSAHCARVGCRTIPHAATTSRSSRQPISHVSSPDMRQTCLLDYPRLFLVGGRCIVVSVSSLAFPWSRSLFGNHWPASASWPCRSITPILMSRAVCSPTYSSGCCKHWFRDMK